LVSNLLLELGSSWEGQLTLGGGLSKVVAQGDLVGTDIFSSDLNWRKISKISVSLIYNLKIIFIDFTFLFFDFLFSQMVLK